MSEVDYTDVSKDIERLAYDSLELIEPICIHCFESGEDDVLGIQNGVQTKYNKEINKLAGRLSQKYFGNDMTCEIEIRDNLIEIFYEKRNELIYDTNRLVEDELSCWYCFENKKRSRDSSELPIRVGDDHGVSNNLFGKSQNDWR